MGHDSHVENPKILPVAKRDDHHVKQVLKVTAILAGVTAVEFILAFGMPASKIRVVIFILLTLVKAGYIVAEFMHLKHEVKMLMYAILAPIMFLCWLIGALLWEGGAVFGDLMSRF